MSKKSKREKNEKGCCKGGACKCGDAQKKCGGDCKCDKNKEDKYKDWT